MRTEAENLPALLTVNQFCTKHPAFPTGGVRYQIFNENSNGLKESGAIIRVGRKVLINEVKYFEWVQAQQVCLSETE